MEDAEAAYLEAEYGDVKAGNWPPIPRRPRRRPYRRPWLAAALSLLLLGLGHVYIGNMRRGLCLWSGAIALFLLSGWAGVLDRFWGLVVVLTALLGLYVYAVRDAAARARRLDAFDLQPYNRWWVYAGLLLFAGTVVAPGVRALVPIGSFVYPSLSMEPTIQAGDHFYARKGRFGAGNLDRRQVVVCESPERPEEFLVFRIVGLPGEEIDLVDQVVHIDGLPLEEPYARFDETEKSLLLPEHYRRARDHFGPFRIPDDSIFVLGDNRNLSLDSRFIGPVPMANVHAKPLYVYWNKPFGQRPDLSRIGQSLE